MWFKDYIIILLKYISVFFVSFDYCLYDILLEVN